MSGLVVELLGGIFIFKDTNKIYTFSVTHSLTYMHGHIVDPLKGKLKVIPISDLVVW